MEDPSEQLVAQALAASEPPGGADAAFWSAISSLEMAGAGSAAPLPPESLLPGRAGGGAGAVVVPAGRPPFLAGGGPDAAAPAAELGQGPPAGASAEAAEAVPLDRAGRRASSEAPAAEVLPGDAGGSDAASAVEAAPPWRDVAGAPGSVGDEDDDEREGAPESREEMTVDEMKIQTMYKMVDDVHTNVGGRSLQKKVLYLTNNQVAHFDKAAMEKCVQALELGNAKFVIRLLPSVGSGAVMRRAHEEKAAEDETTWWGSTYQDSELDSRDARMTEEQVTLFMRSCILPVAKETRAVIVVSGANDCTLAAALTNVALGEQERLGKDCPFTVIATVSTFEIHYRAVHSGRHTLAWQLAHGCRAWRQRLRILDQAWKAEDGEAMQRCDVTPCASRYIVFESWDERQRTSDSSPKEGFESTLLACLTARLPSIAIQSHSSDLGMKHLNALVGRSIPVLLVDSFERAITMERRVAAEGPKTRLAKESDAFPMVSKEQAGAIAQALFNTTDTAGRRELLAVAAAMLERHWDCLMKAGVVDCLDTCILALMHAVLHVGSGSSREASDPVPLHEAIQDMERAAQYNKQSAKAMVPTELVTEAVRIIQTKHAALQQLARLQKVTQWLQNHEPAHEHLVEGAMAYKESKEQQCNRIVENGRSLADGELDSEEWISLYNILTSPHTFSGSFHDIEDLRRILGSVARIDRLPAANSLEVLYILRDAWDHVELYHQVAWRYKAATKVAYHASMLCGFAIILVIISAGLDRAQSRTLIMAIGLVQSVVAAFVAFINPAVRWQQLRMAALSLESNIWTFRTRAGPYRAAGGNQEFDRASGEHLAKVVREIKAGILEGAELKGTSFYSRAASLNLHGQHPASARSFGASGRQRRGGLYSTASDRRADMQAGGRRQARVSPEVCAEPTTDLVALQDVISSASPAGGSKEQLKDCHYEPLQPDAYIRFRVQDALLFYQARIPRCSWARHIGQSLIVLTSCSSVVLAFLGMTDWTAVVSAFGFSVVAYLEFEGISSKVFRYSSTVAALHDAIFWWQTLPQIDRSVVANIDRFVLSCEDILQREQQAWRSTSQAVRMLQKQTQAKSEDEHAAKQR